MNSKKVILFVFFLVFLFFLSCSNIEQPEDAQIHTAYTSATEAMYWFQVNTMLSDYNDQEEADGNIYCKVQHPEIKTMKDLKEYLESLFSDNIVNDLLDTSQYRDINGSLYVQSAARGTDITKGEETYEIIRNSNKKIIFRVNVEILGDDLETVIGYEPHDMIYEYIDGKLVFSKFELVR